MGRGATLGASPGSRAYLIGPDDLEPDFAMEISEVCTIAKNMKEELDKLSKINENMREQITSFTKEENSRFRKEVR